MTNNSSSRQTLDYYQILRTPWNVPQRLKRYICLCERDGLYLPNGIRPTEKSGQYWVCATCEKLPIYHYYICMTCEEPFILDFRHPKFCTLDPLCWDCIKSTGPICNCVLPKVKELLGESPPYLPRPKQFTSEELESVFDF